MRKKYLLLTVGVLLMQVLDVMGQAATLLVIKQSNLIEEINAFKAANPNLTKAQLVEKANLLLETNGLNFVFAFDSTVCDKVDEIKKNQKESNQPINLRTKIKSVDGDAPNLVLPAVESDPVECGRCFVRIAVLAATKFDFVTIISKRNIKFHLPANFVLNQIDLVDNQDLKKIIRSWKIPFKTKPISISDDGTMLFIGFPQPELNDLALILFEDGSFQFYAKSDIDLKKNVGTILKDFPKDENNPNQSFTSFGTGEKKRILRFNSGCK